MNAKTEYIKIKDEQRKGRKMKTIHLSKILHIQLSIYKFFTNTHVTYMRKRVLRINKHGI